MRVANGRDSERLLCLAREGDGRALGQLLEVYRNYLNLLARLQITAGFKASSTPPTSFKRHSWRSTCLSGSSEGPAKLT